MYIREVEVGQTYVMGSGAQACMFTVQGVHYVPGMPVHVRSDKGAFTRPGLTVVTPV